MTVSGSKNGDFRDDDEDKNVCPLTARAVTGIHGSLYVPDSVLCTAQAVPPQNSRKWMLIFIL